MDLLIGFVYQPLVAAVISGYASRNCTFELTVQFLGYVIIQYSTFMVSIVALDRYIHMKYLNRYSALMTPNRANKLLLFNVFLSLLTATLSVVASAYGGFFYFNTTSFAVHGMCTTVPHMIYFKTLRATEKQVSQVRKSFNQRDQEENIDMKDKPKQDIRFAATIKIILVCLVICWSPYFIVVLVWSYYRHLLHSNKQKILDTLIWFSFILFYSNSAMNAIIFIHRNRKIRKLLRSYFRKHEDATSPESGTSDVPERSL